MTPAASDQTANMGAPNTGWGRGGRNPAANRRPIIGDDIEIQPERRLPHLDQGPVLAFAAQSGRAGAPNMFALICERHLIPRLDNAERIAGIANIGLAHLVAWGICYWPPANGERYAFVYEANLGAALLKPDSAGLGWKPEQAMSYLIKPGVSVLLDFRDRDVVSGGIRLTNMYQGKDQVIFGDFLTVPPSFNQPVLYETIERGMADPVARGVGSHEDDLYAFGVSIAVALRTRDPLQGLRDSDIIKAKLEFGSFSALLGAERVTGAVLELLRGLLQDERSERWTINEVVSWLDGRRLSPKQGNRKFKAARPLIFMGEKYFKARDFAMDMYRSELESVQVVENGTLTQWVERSLEDKGIAARLTEAITPLQESSRGSGFADRLLSRVSIALDTEAPLRFHNMNIAPDGIATAMADYVLKAKDPQPFVDIVNQQIITFWATSQEYARADIGSLTTRYDTCRSFLRQQTLGYGVERSLYYMGETVYCASEIFRAHIVSSSSDMAFALEDVAARGDKPHLFVDRHVAAFLSVRDRKVIDPHLSDLNAPEFYRRVRANLKIAALLQSRANAKSLPGFAAWMMEALPPAIERLHDRELREKVRQRLRKAAEAGDLIQMAETLEDQQMLVQDMAGFERAMADHARLRRELAELRHGLESPESFGRDVGRQVAAGASAIIAAVIIMAFIFIHFAHGGAVVLPGMG